MTDAFGCPWSTAQGELGDTPANEPSQRPSTQAPKQRALAAPLGGSVSPQGLPCPGQSHWGLPGASDEGTKWVKKRGQTPACPGGFTFRVKSNLLTTCRYITLLTGTSAPPGGRVTIPSLWKYFKGTLSARRPSQLGRGPKRQT